MITTVLLILALICFFIAALPPWTPAITRVNLVALGLFFWVLSVLVNGSVHLLVR